MSERSDKRLTRLLAPSKKKRRELEKFARKLRQDRAKAAKASTILTNRVTAEKAKDFEFKVIDDEPTTPTE